jgi:L-ascorbate metabolism protein UlaG (beta-lactamase superfamily)
VPLKIRDLPNVDLVIVSHDHYDHLDYRSVMALEDVFSPHFAAPLGCADRLRDWGIASVHEFDWWEYDDLNLQQSDLRLHCLPAIHFSGRTPFDRNTTLWASWMIESNDARIYFGGDTAYGDHFAAIHEAFGPPDAALLPIGAYTPRSIMQAVHVNPQEAVQAALDLGRPAMVPIHWGTFDLAAETIQAPATEVIHYAERAGIIDRLHLLRPGESFGLRIGS